MNDTEYLMQKMTRAFEREGRKFTALEKQFLTAAAHGATGLCHASCDVPRMKALLRERPALLESVGSAALSMAVSYFGTCDAVRFLLDRGVREFYDCETGLYRKHQHEPVTKAFYHGNFDTLRAVFEAGVSNASVISTSHVGWPANTSLLFWAVGRPVEYTQFALAHGADPEASFSGNGERGNTPLQEAAARFGTGRWNSDVADTVRALLGHGAHYDIFSACGMDDLGGREGERRGGLAAGGARRRSRRAGPEGAHAAPPGRVRGQARSGGGAHRPGGGPKAEDEVGEAAAAGGAAGLQAPERGLKADPRRARNPGSTRWMGSAPAPGGRKDRAREPRIRFRAAPGVFIYRGSVETDGKLPR